MKIPFEIKDQLRSQATKQEKADSSLGMTIFLAFDKYCDKYWGPKRITAVGVPHPCFS
jgi:hypothetical protein